MRVKRKEPEIMEAICYDGMNVDEIAEKVCGGSRRKWDNSLQVLTDCGWLGVSLGHWLVVSEMGTATYSPEEFAETFTEVK